MENQSSSTCSSPPSSLPFLLVTANVGSVFEDPSRLLHIWIQEFLAHVAARRPAFIALHLQEVGGKTYEKSMEYVQEFIKNLCESRELADYNRIRVYLDEDYNSAEHFTALGNLYFAIRTIDHLQIWNFLTHEWDTVAGKNIHTGNIESVASKEKAKFPQQFFPECKWSRKGFLRTRWSLNGTVFDLVNIHLFHDASNLAACEEYPSVYCKSRRRALIHTLERFHKDAINQSVPYFVFGDFNFRCDTEGVIKKLTEDLTMHRIASAKSDSTKVQYRDSDGANVLTVGKKEFNHHDQSTFKGSWMRQFDRELESLRSILFEYPVSFPPSYPYEEDPGQPGAYMTTRCPAWCDRILVSPAARKLIDEGGKGYAYGIIGEAVCMGDHKPVYLSIRIKTSQGILTYCSCDTHAQNNRVEHANSTSSSISLNVNNNNNLSNNINNNITSQHHHHLHSSSSESVSQLISSRINNNNDANSNNNRISLPNDLTTTVSTATLTSHRSSTSLLDPVDPNRCSHCFEHIQFLFDEILSELEIPYADEEFLEPTPLKETKVTPARPSVRISVFDTESNANVCMCSLYSSSFSLGGKSVAEATPEGDQAQICPNCRNIIKHQPVEHRKTLVSRRLMLANDIIVNRIDTHYLNTYTSPSGLTSGAAGPGTSGAQFEPYTPESVESHSPVPETVDRMDFDETQVEEPLLTPLPETAPEVPPSEPAVIPPAATKKSAATTTNNNNNSTTTTGSTATTGCGGGVSPRQLKSRLEKLKRISDRQKTYAKTCERLNNSAVGEEVPLAEPGKLTSQGGGEGRPASDSERNDRKLVDCCRRHCCAIQ
uniref:inositol-polyphosphate 5-phosphatase n=1 Tax=Culex pipiens TaxID=7175 RepID=A0A8D8I4I4_CULPI